MKAVVVDIVGKHAVVMSSSGEFIKIKNTGKLQVGYETEIPSKGLFKTGLFKYGNMKRLSSVAAIFLFITLAGIGAYSYTVPYSYVNIDINPSIEITTNIYDRIINVESLNDDGQELILSNQLSNLHNQKLDVGIQAVLKDVAEAGYFEDESKNAVVFAVSSKDAKKADKIESNVQEAVSRDVETKKANTAVVVEKVDIKKHDDAKTAGISPGKMVLIEKLQESKPEVKMEDYKDKPVKEILKSMQPYGYYGMSGGNKPQQGQSTPGQGNKDKGSNGVTGTENSWVYPYAGQNNQNQYTANPYGWGTAGNPRGTQGKNQENATAKPDTKGPDNKKNEGTSGSNPAGNLQKGNSSEKGSYWNSGPDMKNTQKDTRKDSQKGNTGSDLKSDNKDKGSASSASKGKVNDRQEKQNTSPATTQKDAKNAGDEGGKNSGQQNKGSSWSSWLKNAWPFKK